MKRTLCLLLSAIMALALVGCGGGNSAEKSNPVASPSNAGISSVEADPSVSSSASSEQSEKVDFSEQKEMGSGKFYVITQAGSSEDVDSPVIYIDPDVWGTSVEVDAWGFDGTRRTYLYIDGELVDKDQLSDSQITFELSETGMKAGRHTISAVQYDTDDPSGKIVTYKSAVYEAKDM